MMGSYRYESAKAERKPISRRPVRRISTFKPGAEQYAQVAEMHPNYFRDCSKPSNHTLSCNTDSMRDKFLRISCSAPTSEKARIIAYGIKRHIIETKLQVKKSPNFVKKTHAKIVYLHNYNCRVAEVCSIYPLDDDLKELLVKYIELEMSILKNIEYNTDIYRLILERRLLTLLSSIYSKYCVSTKGRFNASDTWQLVLELFEEVPYDVDKFFEDIRQKVIRKIDFGPEPLHTITVQSHLTCYKELDGTVKVEIDLENDPLVSCCEAFNIMPEVQELPVKMVLSDRLAHAGANRPRLACGEVIISDDELTDTGQANDHNDVKQEFDMFLPNLTERLKFLKKQAMLEDKKPEIIDLCDEIQLQSDSSKIARQPNNIITKTNLCRNTVIDLLDSDSDDDGCQTNSVRQSVGKTRAVPRKCDKNVDSLGNLIDDRCKNENVISSLSSAVPERLSDSSSNGHGCKDDNGTCRTQDETEILRQIRELNLLSGSAEVIIKMVNNKLVITPKDNLNTSDINTETEPKALSSDKLLDIRSSPVQYKPVNKDNIQPTIVDLCTEALSPRQQLVEELEETNFNNRIQSNCKENDSSHWNKLSVEAKHVNKNVQSTVVDLCTEALSSVEEVDKFNSINNKIADSKEKDTFHSKTSSAVTSKPVNKLAVVDICTDSLLNQQQFVEELQETNSTNNKLLNIEEKDTSHSTLQIQCTEEAKTVIKDIQPTVVDSCTESLTHQHQIVEVIKEIKSIDNRIEETVEPNEMTSVSVDINFESNTEIVDSTNEQTEIVVIYKSPIDSDTSWTSSESFKSMYETELEQEIQKTSEETTEEKNNEQLVGNQTFQDNTEKVLDQVVTEQTQETITFAVDTSKSADEIFRNVTLRSLEHAKRSRIELEGENYDIDETILLDDDEVVEDTLEINEDLLLREKNDTSGVTEMLANSQATELSSVTSSDLTKDSEETFLKDPQEISLGTVEINQIDIPSAEIPEDIRSEAEMPQIIAEVPQDNELLSEEIPKGIDSEADKLQIINEASRNDEFQRKDMLSNENITSAVATDVQQEEESGKNSIEATDLCKKVLQTVDDIPEENKEVPLETTGMELTTINEIELKNADVSSEAPTKEIIETDINKTAETSVENFNIGTGETLLLEKTQSSSDCREKVNIEKVEGVSVKSTESGKGSNDENIIDFTDVLQSENQTNKEESDLKKHLEVPVHDKCLVREPINDDENQDYSVTLNLQKKTAYLETNTIGLVKGSADSVEMPVGPVKGPVDPIAGPAEPVKKLACPIEELALSEEIRAEMDAIIRFRNMQENEMLLYNPEPAKLTAEQCRILRSEETRARGDPRHFLNAAKNATSQVREVTVNATDLRHVKNLIQDTHSSLIEIHEATDLRSVKDSLPLVETEKAFDQQNDKVLPMESQSRVRTTEIQLGMKQRQTSVEKDVAKTTKKSTKSSKDPKADNILQSDTTSNKTAETEKSEVSCEKPNKVTESYEDNACGASDLGSCKQDTVIANDNIITDLRKNSKRLNIEHAIEGEVNEVAYEEGPVYLEEYFVDNTVEISTCEYYEECNEIDSSDNKVDQRDHIKNAREQDSSKDDDHDAVAKKGRYMSKSTEKQTDRDATKEISLSKALPVVKNLGSKKPCPTEHVVSAESSSGEEELSKGNGSTKETIESELNTNKTSPTSDTSFSIYDRLMVGELLEYMICTIEEAEENQKDIENAANLVLEPTRAASVEVEPQNNHKKSYAKSQQQDGDGKSSKGESSSSKQSPSLETQLINAVQNLDLSALSEEERAEAEATFRNLQEGDIVLYVPGQPKYTKEQMLILRNEETKPRDDPTTFLNTVKKNTTSGSEDNILNLSNTKNKKTKNQTCSGSILDLISAKNDKDDGKSGKSKDSQPLNLATNNNIGERGSGSGLRDDNTSVSTKKHGGSQESEVVPDKQQDNDSKGQQNITDVNRMDLKPSDIPSAEKIASYLPKNGKKMENSSMVLYNGDEDPLQDLRQSLSKYGTVVIPKGNNQDLHLLAETALKHENINSDITDQGSDSEGLLLIDESRISPEYPEVQSEVVLGPSSESYLEPNDFVLQIQNSFQTLLGSGSGNRITSQKSLKNSVTLYKGDTNNEAVMTRKILPKSIPRDYVHVQNYPEVITKHINRRPNILKRKPKSILPVMEKKPYLQPKLIVLTDEPKLSRPKTKAEKKQMPLQEPSRICVRNDSDDDIPLSQRVKSRTPSPKKAKGRYGTTSILIGCPETNDISPLEDKRAVKKTRDKSGNSCPDEVPTTPVKSKTLEKFPGGKLLGKKALRKLGETNKLTPLPTEQRKQSENAVAKPSFLDVHSKLIVPLQDYDENDAGDTRKPYRSKLRPRSCSGSELSVDNSSVPAAELVSQIPEPIGLCVEVKSTDLSNKEPRKRLPSSGKVRKPSATVDDEDMFIVVDNNSHVPDKTLILSPKADADKASYVSKLRRKSGPESNTDSHNLIDLESVVTESDSKIGKKLRTGSPRAKKEVKKESNDTFVQEVVPTVRASGGRGRGRGRGRANRLNKKERSLSNNAKNLKKNLTNLNFIPITKPINDLRPGIDSSETLTSPRKPVKKPNLKLDLNQTVKPCSSTPMVTQNSPSEIKESVQNSPLASATTPSTHLPHKERFKREFKAQIESGKIDVLSPKNSVSIANEENGLNKNQISESKLPNQENLIVESPKIQSDEKDVKKVVHPKLRRKSLFSNCKNTVEATTKKLIKVLQIDPNKLLDESDKVVRGKHSKGEKIMELGNNLRAEDEPISIVTNNSVENNVENLSLPLAESKPSEIQQSTTDVVEETDQRTVDNTVKVTDQPMTQPEIIVPENLTEHHLDQTSENKLLLKGTATVETLQVLENCENISPIISEVEENEPVRDDPLVELNNSSTTLVTAFLGSKNQMEEMPSKKEEVDSKPLSSSETNIDISQDDSMLDDLPLSELKNITLNSKKAEQDLETTSFTCLKTSKQKKRKDQKIEANDTKIVAESVEKVKTQESSLDLKLELKSKATVVKNTSIINDQQHIEPLSLDQNLEQQQKTKSNNQPSVEEIIRESSLEQTEQQILEAPLSTFATSEIHSTKISDPPSNAAAIQTSSSVDDLKDVHKDITKVAKMSSDKESVDGVEQSVLEPNLEADIAAEIDVIKEQPETFVDQKNFKHCRLKESAERPLDNREQTNNDATEPSEISTAFPINKPLKAQQKERTEKSTATVDCQYATISVLAEENSLSKTSDSNDFDLVSIAQEAAKHACENFEEQGTYFDDSGSVVREDIHISVGSEVEVTDTFTGDKEKEHLEIQDKLLHLLHDNQGNETVSQEQTKNNKTEGIDASTEKNKLTRDKKKVSKSVDQNVSTKKEEKVVTTKCSLKVKPEKSPKAVTPSETNLNLTLDDDSDSEVEMKKKYLDKSKRKERGVKQDEKRYEKPKAIAKTDWKKSSGEKHRDIEFKNDKYRNKQRSSRQSRSEERDSKSSGRRGRSESNSSINSTSSISKTAIHRDLKRRKDRGRYSKSATSLSDRDKYNDRRSHSFNSHGGRYDKSRDISNRTEEKNKDKSHKDLEKNTEKNEKSKFNDIKDKHKENKGETSHHSRVDKNVSDRSKEDTQKGEKDTGVGTKRTKSNEHKVCEIGIKLKNSRSCDRIKDTKGNQVHSNTKNTTEIQKDNGKNIGLVILLDRDSILQSYCDSLSKIDNCVNQNVTETDVHNRRKKKKDEKLEGTKADKSNYSNVTLPEEKKNSLKRISKSRKEISLKQTEHVEDKLNVQFQKENTPNDITLSNKNITSVDKEKISEREVPSKKEKTQNRDTIEPKISTSPSSIVEVFANKDKGDNSDVTDLLHDLEANDDNSSKVTHLKTPKDTRSSHTLETAAGKRKSIENDDSIIETTPVQPRKKKKIERSTKSLTTEMRQCDDVTVNLNIIEPTMKQTEENCVEPGVQEPSSLVKVIIEPVCEVQECVKRIEELVIATEGRETAHNKPQKELNITGNEPSESSDSNNIFLEETDKIMDSKEHCNNTIRNEVDTLENENKKIMESLSAGTSGKLDVVVTEDSTTTNENIDIQENSLIFMEQNEDVKFTLPEGLMPSKQHLSDNDFLQESSVIKEETDSHPAHLCEDDVCTTSNTQNENPNKEPEEPNNTVKDVKIPKAEIKKEPVLLIPARRHGRTRVLAPRKNPSQSPKPEISTNEDKNVSRQPLAPEPFIPEEVSMETRVENGQLPQLVFLSDKSVIAAKPHPKCKTDILPAEKIKAHEFQSLEVLVTENKMSNEPQKVTKGRPFQLTADGKIIPVPTPQIRFESDRGNTEREHKRAREEDFSEQSDQAAKKLSVALHQSVQVRALYNNKETLPVIPNLQEIQVAQKHTDDFLKKPEEPQTVLKGGRKLDTQNNSLLAGLELKDDVPYFELSLVTEVTDRLTGSQEGNDLGVHVTLENINLLSQNSDNPLNKQKQDLKTSQQIINETFAQYLGSSDLTPNLQNPITVSQILRENVGSDEIEAAQLKQNANESIKSSPNVNEDLFQQIPNYYRNPSPPETTISSHLSNLDFRNPSPPVTTSLNNLPILESFDKSVGLDPYHVGSDTQRPQILPDFVENKDVNTFFGESRNVSQSNVGSASSLSYASNHIPTTIQGTEIRYQQMYGNNFQSNLVASNIHSPYMSDLSTPVTFYNQQTINATAVSSVPKNIATTNTQCVQTLPGYLHGLKDADFNKIKSEKETEFTRDKEHSDILSSNVKFLEEYPCASPEQVLPNFNRNETFKASPATSTISQHSENTSSVSQHSENTRDTVDVNSVSSGSFQKGDHTYPKDVLMNWHNEDKNELNQNPTGEYVKPITEYDMDELEFDLSLIDESSTPATGIFRHPSSIPTDGVWPFGVEPDNPNKIITSWDESSKVVVEPQPQDYSTYYPDFSCLNNSLAGDIAELSQGSESGDLERGNIDLTDWFNVSDTTEMLSEEMGLEESTIQDSTHENKLVDTTVEKMKMSKPEVKKKLPVARKNTPAAASKIEKENSVSSQSDSKTRTEEVSREKKPEQLPHLVPLSGVTTRSASKRDARETYVTPETQSMHNLRVKSIGDLKSSDNTSSLNKTLVLTNGVPGGMFTVNALLVKTSMSQTRTSTRSTNVANSQISLGSSKDSSLSSRIFTRATALGEALKQQQMTTTPVSTSNSPQVSSEQSKMVTRVATIGLSGDALKQKQLTISKQDIKGKTVHLKVVNPTFLKIVNTSTKNTVEGTSAPPLVALHLENQAKVVSNEPMGQTADASRSILNTYVNKKASVAGNNIKKSGPIKQEVKPIIKKSPAIKSPENTLLFETRTMTKKVKEALSQTLKRPLVEDNANDAKKPCVRSLASDPFDNLVRSPINPVFKNAESKSDNKERDSKGPHQFKSGPHQHSPNGPTVPSSHLSRSGVQQQNPKESLSQSGNQFKSSSQQNNQKEAPQAGHRQNLRVHPLGPQSRSSVYQHPPKEGRELRNISSQHHPKEASGYHNPVYPGHQSRSGSHQRPSRDTAPPGGRYTQGGSDYRGYTEKRHAAHAERSRSAGSRWGSKSPGFNEKERDKSSSKQSLVDTRSKSDYCKTSPSLATSPNGTLLFPELPHKIKRSPGDDSSGGNGSQTQNESKKNESPNEPGQDGTPNKPEEHEWRELMIPKVDPEWMLLPTQRLNSSSGSSK